MKKEKPRITKTVMYNKRRFKGITILDFKFYYMYYWTKNRELN